MNEVAFLLEQLTKDDQAALYKKEFMRIYNIFMTYTVNESKKPSKIANMIKNGFTMLLDGPYDDYFTLIGLADSDYSSIQGLQEIKDDFESTDDEKKW